MPEVVPEMLKTFGFPGNPTTKSHLADARRGRHTSTIADLALEVRLRPTASVCSDLNVCLGLYQNAVCRIGKARAASERPPGFVLGESDIQTTTGGTFRRCWVIVSAANPLVAGPLAASLRLKSWPREKRRRLA